MSLKEKLKQNIEFQEKDKQTWNIRRQEWLEAIDELNLLIITWFNDYKKEGLIDFTTSQKLNSEEFIGAYEVTVLHLIFSNQKEIIIEPKGTLIIGAWGRFDMYLRGFNSDRYYILRFKDESGSFSWNIRNPADKKSIIPLTKDNLEKIFEQWLS